MNPNPCLLVNDGEVFWVHQSDASLSHLAVQHPEWGDVAWRLHALGTPCKAESEAAEVLIPILEAVCHELHGRHKVSDKRTYPQHT